MHASLQRSASPNTESIVESLAGYRHDFHLGRELRIIATVKNCFQVDKNHRQEAQRARQNPEIHGREKVRPFYYGLVAAYSLMVGVPARRIGWMCQCGVQLEVKDGRAVCGACGSEYAEKDGVLSPIDRPGSTR